MSEEDVQQDEATPDAQDEAAPESAGTDDTAVAENVDGLAVDHLTDSKPSPQPEGVQGDPIGDAEEHLASLDMDEERRKAAELMKKL